MTSMLLLAILNFGSPGTHAEVPNPSPSPPLEDSLSPFSDLRPKSPSPRYHQRAEQLFRLGRFSEAVADYGVAARGCTHGH